jgi:hypothetical protein
MSESPVQSARPVVQLARWLAGRPLDGVRRSDATFTRPGRRYTSAARYNSRWHLLPGWAILSVRLLGLWLVLVVVHGWITEPRSLLSLLGHLGDAARVLARWLDSLVRDPGATIGQLLLAGRLALVVLSIWAVRRLASRRRDREFITPLALAVAPILGYEPYAGRRWLRVPRACLPTPPSPVRVRLGLAWRWLILWVADRPGAGWRWLDRLLARVRPPRWWCWVRAAAAIWWEPVASFSRRRARIQISVPHQLGSVPTEIRNSVTSAVTAKIPGEWSSIWDLRGAHPRLYMAPKVRPPVRVPMSVALPAMDAAGDTQLLLGLGANLRPVWWDLSAVDPHMAISAGSGSGKTILETLLEIQAVRRGWAVVLLDTKGDHRSLLRMSKMDLPVWYMHEVAEIHQALLTLAAIRDWRAKIDFTSEGAVPFQKVLILCDELGILAAALRTYWEQNRPKGSPKGSPALAALSALAQAGRSAQMHLVMAAQHLTARTTGSNDNTVKENADLRVLASTPAAWRLLGHGHSPEPRSRIPGRMHVVTAQRVAEIQVPAITSPGDAVDWATGEGSLAGTLPPGVVPFSWSLPEGEWSPPALPAADAPPVLEAGSPDRRTLGEWLSSGVITGKADTWRKRRARAIAAGRFTDTPDHRYTLEQLLDLGG